MAVRPVFLQAKIFRKGCNLSRWQTVLQVKGSGDRRFCKTGKRRWPVRAGARAHGHGRKKTIREGLDGEEEVFCDDPGAGDAFVHAAGAGAGRVSGAAAGHQLRGVGVAARAAGQEFRAAGHRAAGRVCGRVLLQQRVRRVLLQRSVGLHPFHLPEQRQRLRLGVQPRRQLSGQDDGHQLQ